VREHGAAGDPRILFRQILARPHAVSGGNDQSGYPFVVQHGARLAERGLARQRLCVYGDVAAFLGNWIS
jgi:hypothetical protein